MAKDKLNKAVGNSFENLKEDEMKKTQGAGDTEAENFGCLLLKTVLDKLKISLPLDDIGLF